MPKASKRRARAMAGKGKTANEERAGQLKRGEKPTTMTTPKREARTPHVHRFRDCGGNLTTIMEQCGCGETRDRRRTRTERRRWKEEWARRERQAAKLHGVSRDFYRRFVRPGRKGTWRWRGYELMWRVEKWASRHRRDVILCGFDDSHSMSSLLVLILHRSGRILFGTTCYSIPQYENDPIGEFFMYPGHSDELRKALGSLSHFKSWLHHHA